MTEQLSTKHLLGIKYLTREDIELIFETGNDVARSPESRSRR